jgi:hypothetical protein
VGEEVFIEIEARDCVKQARSEPRMKVLLTGELLGARGAVECRVHDISRGGACLDADRPMEVGETVTFRRGPLNASGKVVWSRGKRIGIAFAEPIRATDLFVQMSQSRKSSAPGQQAQPAPISAAARTPFPSR